MAGGINGIPLRLKVLNDEADENKTVSLVNEALKDPSLIAIYGLVSPTQGTKVIKAIGKHKVPFISEISDDSLFASYPNIFTIKTSASDDIRAYTNFIADNYTSTIFIGAADDRNVKRYREALGPVEDRVDLISIHRLPARNSPRYDRAIKAAIAEIKEKKPGIISLSAGISRATDVLRQLAIAGLDIPVFFVNGRIDYAKNSLQGNLYFGDLFELDPMTPNVVNGRLAKLLRQPDFDRLNALDQSEAIRALSYLDILSWLKEAAENTGQPLTPGAMRNHIVSRLLAYRPGRRVFHGLARDWSFTDSHSRAQLSLIRWWVKASDRPVIWKTQYKPDGKRVTQIPVAYFSIDVMRIVSVDSNKKSFDAEFYASVASHQNVGLERFEFANAMLSQDNGSPLIHTRQIDGSPPAVHSHGKRRLYKVSGSFRFDPDLTRYPFDQQPFTISVQARDSTLPVFVQPPPANLRDKNIFIEGWRLLEGSNNSYIGFDTSTVTLADNHMTNQEVVNFYNYKFTWIAKRLTFNYYLRVIIPLALIVLVAYASIFMPTARVESAVAIQVTALLSTIALYFSIPKFNSATATLSDRIFVFTEGMIVLMIVSSIIRVIVSHFKSKIPSRLVMAFQAITVPALCYLMVRYILITNHDAGAVFAGKSIKEMIVLLIGFG
ncbi:MAG: ABC transporter substrate-binding protein [Hyphomicrobiaceae bacterium]|nr:ABC transporter substrate-binding protein [Hyphomicrobiaceae bacterium]